MSVKAEQKSESLAIGTLFKFIKPFDGSREKLNSFISLCQSAYDLATDNQKPILLTYILSQLEGKAEAACSIKEFEDWKQLSEFLTSQFGETKHYAHLLLDLQECHQLSNESVTQFSLRLETCLSKLLTEVTLSNKKKLELPGRLAAMEDLALHTFLLGLKPNISNLVRGKNPVNLNSAINFATSEEKIQKLLHRRNVQNHSTPQRPPQGSSSFRPVIHNISNRQRNPNQFSIPICRYCKNQGHTIENCKKRQFNHGNFNNGGKPSRFPTNQPQRQIPNQFQQQSQNNFNKKPFNGQSTRVHFINDNDEQVEVPEYSQEYDSQNYDSQDYNFQNHDFQSYDSQNYDSQEHYDTIENDDHLNN